MSDGKFSWKTFWFLGRPPSSFFSYLSARVIFVISNNNYNEKSQQKVTVHLLTFLVAKCLKLLHYVSNSSDIFFMKTLGIQHQKTLPWSMFIKIVELFRRYFLQNVYSWLQFHMLILYVIILATDIICENPCRNKNCCVLYLFISKPTMAISRKWCFTCFNPLMLGGNKKVTHT